MTKTPNHNYNVPEKGQDDWSSPINENFRQYDTDIEIRDLDANKSDYEPKDGAKFLATDTGRVYLGDGAAWNELSLGGAGHAIKRIVYQQRGQPTASSLGDGEVMTYASNGSGSHGAGDLVYAVNDDGTIKTQVIAKMSNATAVSSVVYDFEDADLSEWEMHGHDSQNEMGIANEGHDSQHSLYLDHNGSITNFWVETTLDNVVSPTTFSFWIQPTKTDQYSKDMFRIRNGGTDVIWFSNHRENDGVYFRFGDGNDEEDRKRIRDGAITEDINRFVEVRLEQINWGDGTIGKVYIDGEQTATDAPFLNTLPGFDAVAPYSVGGGNSAFRIDNIGWE